MRKTDHIPLAEIELVTYEIVQKDRVEFSCPCSCCYAFWRHSLFPTVSFITYICAQYSLLHESMCVMVFASGVCLCVGPCIK
jgi:hypothetical protein